MKSESLVLTASTAYPNHGADDQESNVRVGEGS